MNAAAASLRALLADAAQRLAVVADSPRLEAEWIWCEALGCTRASLLARDRDVPSPVAAATAEALLARRAAGEPMAYVLGRRGFWTLELQVSPAVLIPRPETEGLVEWALQLLKARADARIADLGTGSGAIALALASERPQWQVLATDASTAALAVAKTNAQRLGLRNVEFRHGDWFAPLLGERFDVLLSNPPYIEAADPHLAALAHEPRSALVAGEEGLDDLRRICAQASVHLNDGGWLLLEHGMAQGEAVRTLLREAGFVDVQTRRDLAGRERLSGGRRA